MPFPSFLCDKMTVMQGKIKFLLPFLFFVSLLIGEPQKEKSKSYCFFYKPYQVLSLRGKVKKIEKDVIFCDCSSFLTLLIEDPSTGKEFRVFLAPIWYLAVDFEKGEEIKVVGSPVKFQGKNGIIAKEVYWRGERILLRDGRGFPYWRSWRRRGRMHRRKWRD